MQRTQISLSSEDRELLDARAAETGLSISALIRDAVRQCYGGQRSVDADIASLNAAFGGWGERDVDGADFVERLRSGRRWAHRTAEEPA